MWSKSKPKRRLQLILTADRLHAVELMRVTTQRYAVQAYEQCNITYTPAGLMWDLNGIKQQLAAWVAQHTWSDAWVQIVLMPPLITQSLRYVMHYGVPREQLLKEQQPHRRYLYGVVGAYEDCYLLYTTHAGYPLLFQLELMLLDVPLHLQGIMPLLLAEQGLYAAVKGVVYRASDFAYALDHASNRLHATYTQVVRSMIMGYLHEDAEIINSALGSFVGEEYGVESIWQ